MWLPVWLVGMGIISWQGQFSGGAVAAPLNTNRIPFWWDMVIVAAFSLVIYYWAMATKLPREEMMNLVNQAGRARERRVGSLAGPSPDRPALPAELAGGPFPHPGRGLRAFQVLLVLATAVAP